MSPIRVTARAGLAGLELDRSADPALSGLMAALERVAHDPSITFDDLRADFVRQTASLPVRDDVVVTPTEVVGRPAELMEPAEVVRTGVYLHGGAYTIGSLDTVRALAAQVAATTRSRLLVLDYRLAPEHPFPAAVDDAVGALAWVRDRADGLPVVLLGDSAGGSLALQTALTADVGPDAVVAMSPWTDLSLPFGEAMDACVDPQAPRWMLERSAEAYAAGPAGSPRHGDLGALPPSLVQVGTAETLLDDGLAFAGVAFDAGAPVTLEVWAGMPHVWQAFAPRLAPGVEALESADTWLTEVLGG